MTTVSTFLEAGTWTIDPAHTSIGFSVKHLMAARVRGRFDSFSGTITAADTPEESAVEVSIDAASIDTGIEDRDEHLRSGDFLDAENFPTLTFASTDVRESDSGWEIEGDLTIRGVTKPVVLEADFGGVVEDPWGNEKAIFSAATTIEREDWGLTWNQALEAGGWLVGKKVKIEIEAQAQKS
jgi:polyisoprenoid-binding protein YceI